MEASLFAALAPVSGLVLAIVFLNEQAGWQQLVGAACVLLAIVLPLCRRKAAAPQEQRQAPRRGQVSLGGGGQ
jgi:drug/metabolite transporter (DMT)-like permease